MKTCFFCAHHSEHPPLILKKHMGTLKRIFFDELEAREDDKYNYSNEDAYRDYKNSEIAAMGR